MEYLVPQPQLEGLSEFPILTALRQIVSVVSAQFLCLAVIIQALLYPICVIKPGWLPHGHATSEMEAFNVL